VTLYAQWHINQYTVTFNKNGGDTDASPTTRTTDYNTTVTLPAEPTKVGYHFDSWNTQATGTGSTFDGSTAVTADITVYAQWHINTYTLTVNTVGNGTVVSDPLPVGGKYDYNTVVTLTATPDTGWHFTGWTGATEDVIDPLKATVTMDVDKSVTATFEEDFILTPTAGAGGAIGANPDLLTYPPGTVVLLTAVPEDGYYFVYWYGIDVPTGHETDNPLEVIMNADKLDIVAEFAKDKGPVGGMVYPINKTGILRSVLVVPAALLPLVALLALWMELRRRRLHRGT
jgi:uncharacterized repeat protein (TIGR02543 family)